MDYEHEILKLKKELNTVILAHYYQDGEIQDVADFVGDSLALAQQAAKTTADVIVFCGVHFMAETAKILNPNKLVLLPDLAAGCSLSDRCPPDQFKAFKDKHPDHFVATYVNSSAAVKANGAVLKTAQGGTITVAVYGGPEISLWDKDRNSRNARVILSQVDINKYNKQVAHGIDRVLRPIDLPPLAHS